MAETATGVSWEDLVKREVFERLDLTGVGVGPAKAVFVARCERGALDFMLVLDDRSRVAGIGSGPAPKAGYSIPAMTIRVCGSGRPAWE